MLRIFLGHVRRDIAYGVRGLARAPGFALVAILTLGVGLGATAGDGEDGDVLDILVDSHGVIGVRPSVSSMNC